MQTTIFNQAQMHVLNMASRIKTDGEHERLKDQLAKYYASLVDDEMDELWESGEWNEAKLAELNGSHLRTKYK